MSTGVILGQHSPSDEVGAQGDERQRQHRAARDYLIRTNHCTTTTQPIDPSPCVAYQGCDAGYPVIWCEHTGGHTVPSFAPAAVATFFQQF